MIEFYKYQGTGNDFIMIDNRSGRIDRTDLGFVQQWCDRKFGIGADGMILIEEHPTADFEMVYFNSDGSMSFCGNGSRCAVKFAAYLGLIAKETEFLAIDGLHQARIDNDGLVHLKMNDVQDVEIGADYYYLNTGSPHYIEYVDNINEIELIDRAQAIRYNDRFKKEGTNVNFVEELDDRLVVRTYERGVENETLSCGTGVTAVALSAVFRGNNKHVVKLEVMGGRLEVSYERNEENGFQNIWLIGPGELVFKGVINE